MALRRRNRLRREGAKASIDMNSLIDLTFLLLVVFIVTLPTLEQKVDVKLPVGEAREQDSHDPRSLSITVKTVSGAKDGAAFYLDDRQMDLDAIRAELEQAIRDDPDASVVIRGDTEAAYGEIFKVVKVAHGCNVRNLGLAHAAQGD